MTTSMNPNDTVPNETRAERSPDARAVLEFHRNDDVNSRGEAHHHTLGRGHSQASWGDHLHDGQTGEALLLGVTFTGSRTTNAASVLDQICNALSALGAVNSTSA